MFIVVNLLQAADYCTCNCRASYPDMGGSWVKQVELDEPMQVSEINLHLPYRHREIKFTPQWSASYSLFSMYTLRTYNAQRFVHDLQTYDAIFSIYQF